MTKKLNESNYHANRTGFSRGPRDDERHDLDTPTQVWGLKINGKVWMKDGKAIEFATREKALTAKETMLSKKPDLEIGLVTKNKSINETVYQGQFPTKEAAIAYAKDSVKRFRDPEDGVEIWAMPGGGFDTVATMNSNSRNHCMANGGKKLGTVGPRYQGVAEGADLAWDDPDLVQARKIIAARKANKKPAQKVNPAKTKQPTTDKKVSEDAGYNGSEPLDLDTKPSVNDVFKRALYIYDYEGYGNDGDYSEDEAIDQYVRSQFGEKVLNQLEDARYRSYFGREGGNKGGHIRSSNLGTAGSTGDKFRTTKAGKMHGQDANMMKNKIADRLGRHPEPVLPESSQRVDSLVTDALKIMHGPELNDAVQALKTVLGNREYNDRRNHYNFYVKQMIDMYSKKGSLKEFAIGPGGGESGRWYTDDQMTDLVGDGWWNDLDVSGDISKQEMIQEAQAWLDDQGYSVHVLNCKLNDDDMEWYIEGSFHNSNFAKKGVAEDTLNENASKLLSARDIDGVIFVVVQAPDGTKKSKSDENPRFIQAWLMKYGLELPKNITGKFVMEFDSCSCGFNEDVNCTVHNKLNELSTDKLTQYKKAAGVDATKADKEGDYARGNKRFSGINKATSKQFDNDSKKVKEGSSSDYRAFFDKEDSKINKTAPPSNHNPRFNSKQEYADWAAKNKQKDLLQQPKDVKEGSSSDYRAFFDKEDSNLNKNTQFKQGPKFNSKQEYADWVTKNKLQKGDTTKSAGVNEEEDPCWDGYKQLGMKKKAGKKVPNCVPVKESTSSILEGIGKVDEGWKEKLGAAALTGAMALGAGGAHARVTPGDDPSINRLTGKPNVTQQATDTAPTKVDAPKGFNKEYLQSVVDGKHPRPLISVEKAQELLKNIP